MANQNMLISLHSLSLDPCSLKNSRKGTLPAESRKWMTRTECISNVASEVFNVERKFCTVYHKIYTFKDP